MSINTCAPAARSRRPAGQMDETTPNWVVNAYGLSKIAGEATVQMLHARTGAQAISIRPALVIAPEEYAMRIGQLRGGRPKTWLSWSYTDAEDLAEAFRLSVEKDDLGCEALYIVNDEAFTDEPIERCIADAYRDAGHARHQRARPRGGHLQREGETPARLETAPFVA